MARCMQSDRCHLADRHLLFVREPVVRRWNGHVRDSERPALHLEHVPELTIVLVQA